MKMDITKLGEKLENYLTMFPDMVISEEDAEAEGGFFLISRTITVDNRDIQYARDEYQLLGGIALEVYDVFTTIFADNHISRATSFKVTQPELDSTVKTFGVELKVQIFAI